MVERVKSNPPYKVGYAKPPKHTRFTKGRSGNPSGRPAGSTNLATMVTEELTKTVFIVENGRRTKIPKIRAAFRQALNKAMMGDFKALQQIVTMVRSHDTLKHVATSKPKIPTIHSGMSLREAMDAYQQTLMQDED
jgi:hypothetical protein